MYSIAIHTDKEGYTTIRLCDREGFVCAYCGFGNWPLLSLLAEHGIDCR